MVSYFNFIGNLYNIIFILTLSYIIIYLLFREFIKNKDKDVQSINNIKIYFDKMFIIKLIKLVKENLLLLSPIHNINYELKAYLELESVIIYRNIGITNSKQEASPEFIALDNNFHARRINLNEYIESNDISYLQNRLNNKAYFVVSQNTNQELINHYIFPLKSHNKIIGALTIVRSNKEVLQAQEIEILSVACNLLEMSLIYHSHDARNNNSLSLIAKEEFLS